MGLTFLPERIGVGVEAAVVCGADGATAGVRYRSKTRRSVGHHHADGPSQFALNANAVRRRVGLATVQKGADDFQKLAFIDWAAAQFKIDRNVFADRS